MKDKARIKSAILCGVGVVLIILFICLTLRGNKDTENLENKTDEQAQTEATEATEDDFGIGSSPDINTNTGTNEKKVTPGGVEYSFIDTTGMTEEEIIALETRLDEEAGYSFDPNTNLGGQESTRGMYTNKVLSCTFPSGSVLKIGIDMDNADALYLNPVYEAVEEENIFSAEETAFAFYLKTMFGEDLVTASNLQAVYNEGSNVGSKYFVIQDRTYDTLVPASYNDAVNYGVKWTDLNNYHGYDGSDYDMEIRVVRLPDGQLMGTAKMHIAFDSSSSSYSVTSLVYSDVAATGELTADERSAVVDKAFEFFCSDDKGQSTFVDRSYWSAYRERAVVEKVDWLYFSRLFDASGNVATAGKFSGMDVYAVNLNYPGYGFATIYMAPQQQIDGLRGSTDARADLQPFAYDAFKPFTSSTLFVPAFQQEEFYN